jgi:uncharacterized Zn ribbon protein
MVTTGMAPPLREGTRIGGIFLQNSDLRADSSCEKVRTAMMLRGPGTPMLFEG